MSYQLIGQPCRNFNILGSTTLVDPVDGREKVVLSNFAAGATGNLIFIDPETGVGESVTLPGDEGAWALFNLDNEALLVGTCARAGYLHRLDLRSRSWAEPLRDEGQTYIWNLCRGDDGLIYGGTYPGCVLLRYDPVAHELENMGRISDNPDNLYTRHVYAVPGHILIDCWSADRHLALWNLESGETRRFGPAGAEVKIATSELICTEVDGELNFYDATTFAPLADHAPRLPIEPELPYSGVRHVLPLRDGRFFGVRGQEYFISNGSEPQPTLRPIPTPRPPTRIHTLTAAPDGLLWGSCGFGQTIFSSDPQSGEHWNSEGVCDQGGEVYGMAFAGERLFLSAYVGGDHILYDPRQAWDQVGNRNPRTLDAVAPAYIRPEARSVIGPDGHFWTGWMAQYGRYGGALSRVDVETEEITLWTEPVPQQPVVGLAADERYLYFVTGGKGNGLPDKEEPFHFVVWEPTEAIVWQQTFAAGRKLGQVAAVGGRVLVTVDAEIHLFDPDAMAWERTVTLTHPCQQMVTLKNGRALLFCADTVWTLDPQTGEPNHLCELPGSAAAATVAPNGTVYFSVGTELYALLKTTEDG